MKDLFIDIAAALAMVGIVLALEFGGLSKADAFFLASATATAYVGRQLIQMDGVQVKTALAEIFARPRRFPHVGVYVATLAVPALAVVVAAQVLLQF